MAFYKIIVKGSYYPRVLAVIKGKDEDHAISRFRRLSGDYGEVVAVKTKW